MLKKDRMRRLHKDRVTDIYAKEQQMKQSVSNTTNARDLVMVQLADQIFSKGHTHVATATNISFIPDGNPAMPLVALAGRGQVGKTSLLRSLLRSSNHVSISNRQLRRDAMNYFNVGDVFNVVDLPGCGGTSVPWSCVLQHAVLLRNFVRYQPSLKMLYYCMDVHYQNGVYVQDMDMLKFLSKEIPNFTIVITKGDQVAGGGNGKNLRLKDIRQELLYNDIHHPVIMTSAFRMGGIDTLRFDMVMNTLHALPTERLTFTEAKRLSERLLSQKELSTVRAYAIAPTQLDDDMREWNKALESERQEPMAALPPPSPKETESASTAAVDVAANDGNDENCTSDKLAPDAAGASAATSPSKGEFDVDVTAITEQVMSESASQKNDKAVAVVFPHDVSLQKAYESVVKKTQNTGLMKFVKETSPYRNPLSWPEHVVPTKHPKSNIMRCPGDPQNPYLFQPTFVAPRADMCFRRPNVGVRKSSQKGKYEADQPLAYLLKPYTIPYFPDIVDTDMHPQPWTFLGSREAYYERGGGRQLGIRLSQHARTGEKNALLDTPAPSDEALTKEVRMLEEKRYGRTPIAMLRPPGVPPLHIGHDDNNNNAGGTIQ